MTNENTNQTAVAASDDDTRLAKWIFFALLLLAGSLLAIMAGPRILEMIG
jgi:hypothetical protein